MPHTPNLSLPLELVPATEHHGAYICNGYGGTVCDFYTMSLPNERSSANGGQSKPVPFVNADEYAAFMTMAANTHAALRDALRGILAAMETDEDKDPTQSWLDNLYASADRARAALAQCGGE